MDPNKSQADQPQLPPILSSQHGCQRRTCPENGFRVFRKFPGTDETGSRTESPGILAAKMRTIHKKERGRGTFSHEGTKMKLD